MKNENTGTPKSRLIDYCRRHKITNKQFADAVGVSVGYLSNIRKNPNYDVINKFCDVFGVNRKYIVFGEGLEDQNASRLAQLENENAQLKKEIKTLQESNNYLKKLQKK